MISTSIDKKELQKALNEIKLAEFNGFKFCIPTFKMSILGTDITTTKMIFNGLVVKAHSTNGKYNYGRSNIYQYMKFIAGELIEIK